MGATWTVIVALLGIVAWLSYTAVQQRKRLNKQDERLNQQEATLNQYSSNFHNFMAQKSQELHAQVAKDIASIKSGADAKIAAAVQEVQAKFGKVDVEVARKLQDVSKSIKEGAEEAKVEAKKVIDGQLADFKTLMKNAYLDEYDKMKVNPPRPKKGPRKHVDPPSKYRSLDDE